MLKYLYSSEPLTLKCRQDQIACFAVDNLQTMLVERPPVPGVALLLGDLERWHNGHAGVVGPLSERPFTYDIHKMFGCF